MRTDAQKKEGGRAFFPAQLESIAAQSNGITAIRTILTDIAERRQFEKERETARKDLEKRVEERTAELLRANTLLQKEIEERKQAEESIRHLVSFPQMNPNPVIETNVSGEIIFFNPASRAVLDDLGMEKGTSRPSSPRIWTPF